MITSPASEIINCGTEVSIGRTPEAAFGLTLTKGSFVPYN